VTKPLAFHEFSYWMMHYRRTWRRSAILSFANPVMFFIGIGIGLGHLIDTGQASSLHGVKYLAFLAPGLLAATAMQTAAIESGNPAFMSLHTNRNYRAAALTPLEPGDILAGHALFITFRLALNAAAFAIAMLCFGVTASPLLAITLPVAILTGLALSLPLMAFGVYVRERETLAVVARFLFMPMYLFSGTYVAVGQLPRILHPLIYALPLWHGVELCRALTLGTLTTGAVVLHLGYLLTLCIGGAILARMAYRRALRD
jgi:lipooligosaccharide transport system permease protein